MLTACPECGTQVVAGNDCPLCGTPTPAPTDSAAAESPPGPATPREPSPEPAQPVRGAAPPPDAGVSRPMDTVARYANQWEVIYDKLRSAVAPKYEVTGILGYGGMAGVYLADEPRLGRKVAIKVMSPGLMVDPQLVERFSQEARTIAQLNHPNIVTIYEVDERDGLHYFTMTYVAGRTLGQVMAGTEGALSIDVVRAWLYQIGDALAYAHHHGVIHRDVKPGNVLLDKRGNALVTDFGIAKVTDEPGLTRTGMLVGTPAYMSPEQCSSGKVEGASDQ
jgi:serine/threonine-protein kinase